MKLAVGTWPIGPGQSVSITWTSIGARGNQADGIVAAQWQHNTDVNSYWTAHLGPFADGDRVFAGLAKAQGWYAEGPIEHAKDVGPALKRAIARVKAGQPALLDTITQRR